MKRLKQALMPVMLVMGMAATGLAQSPPPGMARIAGGVFRPLFTGTNNPGQIPVRAYFLDILPVTRGEFLAFVHANPAWRKSQVQRAFADETYLRDWPADLDPGTNSPLDAPVTQVSWFAAKAYANWKGKRLPSVAEWELTASAGFTSADGEQDAAFKAQVLEWYRTPSPRQLPSVGAGRANFWGVQDLHGLIWEWTADFDGAMVTGDARNDSGTARDVFCGAGSQGAKDVANFPAFMRYGFRSSLKRDYCVHNLGFRCARDLLPSVLETASSGPAKP